MDPILKILKASKGVIIKGEWALNRKAGYKLPKQGWKLHISATLLLAPVVLKRCLPLLLKEKMHFKIVSTISLLNKINQGKFGLSQMGKFITVYPKSDKHAVKLAKLLDSVAKGLEGPIILSDRSFRTNSLVHYRYGSFLVSKDSTIGNFYIIGPSGKKIEDKRGIYYNPPDWVVDPFASVSRDATQQQEPRLFGSKFLILACLYQGAGGGVYRALDLKSSEKPQQVVLKEARKHAAEDLLGRDARKRLEHEASILKKLSGLKPAPKFYELFGVDENLYLSMEYILGRSLEHFMKDQCKKKKFIPERTVKNFGIKLCEAVQPIQGELLCVI